MSIRPLHDRVVVRRLDEERTTAGGIVLPDSATEKPMEGVVVSVGNGKVLFGKYSGTEVKIDGEELLVMREDDIMAVVE